MAALLDVTNSQLCQPGSAIKPAMAAVETLVHASQPSPSPPLDAAAGLSTADLEAAFEAFAEERANLAARTEHAGMVVAAALGQLRRTEPQPAVAGARRQAPRRQEATQLQRRDMELEEKLQRALEDSQALQAQIAEFVQAHAGVDATPQHPPCTTPQAGQSQLAGLVQQLSEDAALLAGQVDAAVEGMEQQQPAAALVAHECAAVEGMEAELPQGAPVVVGEAAGAIPIGAPQRGGGPLDVPQQPRPAIASHQPCFSLGMDWSAVAVLGEERADAFRPGTSVRDFACHQEDVAAYLTTQQGVRDGKRRRLAAGMLAQCLARRRPAAEPRASTGSGAAAPADGGPQAAGHRRTVVRMQPLVEEWGVAIAEGGGSVAAAAADASAAAPLPGVMPSPVALLSAPWPSPAAPHSGLPSRTPKRKLSDRFQEDEPDAVQSELGPAFDRLAVAVGQLAPGGALPAAPTAGSRQPVAAGGREGGEGSQPEWDTFALMEERWHGGAQQAQRRRGGSARERAQQARSTRSGTRGGICVIS